MKPTQDTSSEYEELGLKVSEFINNQRYAACVLQKKRRAALEDEINSTREGGDAPSLITAEQSRGADALTHPFYESLKLFISHYYKEISSPAQIAKFYSSANISSGAFSNYRHFNKRLSRNVAYRIILMLKLSLSEAEELMALVGLVFDRTNSDDLVVMYCLINRIYDYDKIDFLLDTRGSKIKLFAGVRGADE